MNFLRTILKQLFEIEAIKLRMNKKCLEDVISHLLQSHSCTLREDYKTNCCIRKSDLNFLLQLHHVGTM